MQQQLLGNIEFSVCFLITIIGQKEFLPMIKKELPKVNIKYVTKDSSPTIVKERFVEEISK